MHGSNKTSWGREWERKILDLLRRKGPLYRQRIKEELNVPKAKERTFYRAINRLIYVEAAKAQDDGKIAAVGVETPKNIRVSVGPPRLIRMSFELGTGYFRRILNNRELVREIIVKRRGPVYEFLSELGVL